MTSRKRGRPGRTGQAERFDLVAELARAAEIGPMPATKDQCRYVNHSQLLRTKPEFEQEYPARFGETWAEFVKRLQPFPDDYQAG